MIYDELPSAWRFVDDEKKLTVNKNCIDCKDEAEILSTTTAILPAFIFKTSGLFFTPLNFSFNTADGLSGFSLASEIANMKLFTIGGITYVTLNTRTYNPLTSPLSTGIYYAQITDGVHTIYSEPISICDHTDYCVRLDWTHTCDLAGIPYDYLKTLYGSDFLNTWIITDMKLISPDYETQKEKLENMLRQTDNFFLNQTRTFSLKHKEVPEWFVRALQVMQLHNKITVTYDIDNNHQTGLYTTSVEECSVTSTVNEIQGDSICSSSVDIRIRQDDAVITTYCCVNSEPDACLEKCADVVGFKVAGFPSVGDYQIVDFDSNMIQKYIGEETYGPAFPCNFVFNTNDNRYLYFNGDIWQYAPDISSVTIVATNPFSLDIEIIGFLLPGMWAYIGTNAGDGCKYSDIPYTAQQFTDGFVITIPKLSGITLCVKMMNNNCSYDEIQLEFPL